MATPQRQSPSSTAAGDQRVLQSLIHYLRRRNIKEDDIPFDDPVLQSKTIGQINAAFASIKEQTHTPLDSYYLKLMNGRDEYCTTPGIQARDTDWMPLANLRWRPITCDHLIAGSTMMIFSAVDVFSIMWMRVELERTVRCFYGIQSLLAREKAAYYLAYTANPRARTPSWRLRSLGNHEIARGLPVVLSATSNFSGAARRLFEQLNPLPPLQPIPPEQASFHDFVVQIVTGTRHHGRIEYEGDRFTNVNLADETPPPVARDTRQGGTRANLNETLLERARRSNVAATQVPNQGHNANAARLQREAAAAVNATTGARTRRRTTNQRRQGINETLARMAGTTPDQVENAQRDDG